MTSKSKPTLTKPLRVPHVSNKRSLAHLTSRSGQVHEPVYGAFYTTPVQNVDRVCNLAHSHDVAHQRLVKMPAEDPDYAALTEHVTRIGQELLEVKESLRRDLAELAVYRAEDKSRYGEGLPLREYVVKGQCVKDLKMESYSVVATSPEAAVLSFVESFARNPSDSFCYYVETKGEPHVPVLLVQGLWHHGEPAAYVSGYAPTT